MTTKDAAKDRQSGGAAPGDQVWKALSDPTRREILDLLRRAPHTTGELAELFPVSRYAVMKHLKVLVRARLVTVRRRGRERFNHLNAVPLRQIYERYVRPFEGSWADKLLQIKGRAERREEELMADAKSTGSGNGEQGRPEDRFRVHEIAQEVAIAAPAERVWEALLAEIGDWWPADHLAGGEAARMVLEPFLGGRLYEDWGEGAGMTWGTVTLLRPGSELWIHGGIARKFGGPSGVHTHFKVRPDDTDNGGSVLELTDIAFGAGGDQLHDDLETGWEGVLRGHFKPHVEAGGGS